MVWFCTIRGSRVVEVGGQSRYKEVGPVHDVRRVNTSPFHLIRHTSSGDLCFPMMIGACCRCLVEFFG